MRVIAPLFVATQASVAAADQFLTSSNVTEPFTGEAVWNSATSYTVGQIVIRPTTHMKYENIQAGINATLPETDAALAIPTRWIRRGPTNKYAMFDQLRSTQTSTTSPLIVVITPNKRINSFCATGLVGESLTVSMTQGGIEIYSVTQNLTTRIVKNYYDYCYAEFGNIPAFAKFDLPPASNGVITFTLSSTASNVKCSGFTVGNQTYLGSLRLGAKIGSLNFSKIDRAFDGTATLVPRPSKPTVSGQLYSDATITDKVLAIRTLLDGVPAIFSGLDDEINDPRFAGLLISGLLRRLEPSLDYQDTNLIDIEIEEI